MPEISPLEASIIELAERKDCVAEVCDFIDYHPDYGRVPEHWRVKWQIMMVARHVSVDK